ncbi:hypothetical protein [Nocardiopsis flavescens]|uniref:hypothetical protein n=1 Tax=Nocardiopsis flavescens TaxID=758803 RepID=UPI001161452D|nr:hypothetical protein [Nocardiopsis flavescens]
MENAQRGGPLAGIRQASLAAAASKFKELAPVAQPDFEIHMVDVKSQGHAVSASDAGELLRRVQRAVARLAKARRLRRADVSRLSSGDFSLARFNVVSASFASLKVHLVPDKTFYDEDNEESVPLSGPSWAEVGLAELIRALPEGENDDASIESLMGASPVVRRAVADLVFKLNSDIEIGFQFKSSSGEKIVSRVTPVQVRKIAQKLEMTHEDRSVVRMRGRLDGLRTRRQIFYFEPEKAPEIHGYVDESLMSAVRENIDREVDVTLEVVVERSFSGKVSQRHYRLLSVDGHQSEIPEYVDTPRGES